MAKAKQGKLKLRIPRDITAALAEAKNRPAPDAPQKEKKNYAERFSRALATLVARALRPDFSGITPDEGGKRQEQPARTSKGVKKLDVNYSTPELGLGLGVSIKTVTHPDPKSGRFTKNFTRIDNELRAEAMDYHVRQPYSVLVAVLFLPIAAAREQVRPKKPSKAKAAPNTRQPSPSSFAAAVRSLRFRAGRQHPVGEPELFEAAFVALYEPEGDLQGSVSFFDVSKAPPRRGVPDDTMTFEEFIHRIRSIYDARNKPEFKYAD